MNKQWHFGIIGTRNQAFFNQNHPHVIQNVIDTLNGISNPDTPISEGISVVEIIENVYVKRNLNFF